MTNAGRPLKGHTLTYGDVGVKLFGKSRFAENHLEFADYMREVVIVVCTYISG
jgi:hypothetical protein